jgi:acetyl-CoA acyltransferase
MMERTQPRLHSIIELTPYAVAADDPVMMLTAVIPATSKVLRKAGLSIEDIDLFEVNGE